MFNISKSIPFLIPVLLCAFVFISIGLIALKSEKPITFWSGTTIKPEDITDISSYNRANAKMWIIYGCTYILSAIIVMVSNILIGTIIMSICCIGGIVVMIAIYSKIYNKYKK